VYKLGEIERIRHALFENLSKQTPKWQQLAHMMAPERYKHRGGQRNDGSRKDLKIIKDQARRSLRIFSSGMMNGATPKARPWYNLTVSDETKARNSEARRCFKASENILNSHFHLSNLYRVLPMSYQDVGVFSNAAFAMLPHVRYGFYFYHYMVGTYSFACDAEGNPQMFTRDAVMTVKQIVDSYGQLDANGRIDWSNLPDSIKNYYEQSEYNQEFVINQTIVPNKNYNPSKPAFYSKDRKYQCYTFVVSVAGNLPPQINNGFRNEKETGDGKPFLRVSGYSYFPVVIPRWEVAAEEDFGTGAPGDLALADINTLQRLEQDRLDAVAKGIRPPMIGHSSMRRHQASILPGGITYLDDQAWQNGGFKPAMNIDMRINDLISAQSEYVQSIRGAFFEDLFLMLSGERTVSHVSAREIDEKAAERLATLSPVMGQLDQDQNSKIITNAQIILEEAGKLPPRPRILEGEQMRPEYISILAQAAKASQMNSLERFVGFVTNLSAATQNPALLRLVDGEQAIREYGDYVAVNPSIVPSEQEFAEIQQAMAQQQQMAQQMQLASQEAAISKDLSAAKVGEGSMLDAYMTASQV
jgi:hypothetical protein